MLQFHSDLHFCLPAQGWIIQAVLHLCREISKHHFSCAWRGDVFGSVSITLLQTRLHLPPSLQQPKGWCLLISSARWNAERRTVSYETPSILQPLLPAQAVPSRAGPREQPGAPLPGGDAIAPDRLSWWRAPCLLGCPKLLGMLLLLSFRSIFLLLVRWLSLNWKLAFLGLGLEMNLLLLHLFERNY